MTRYRLLSGIRTYLCIACMLEVVADSVGGYRLDEEEVRGAYNWILRALSQVSMGEADYVISQDLMGKLEVSVNHLFSLIIPEDRHPSISKHQPTYSLLVGAPSNRHDRRQHSPLRQLLPPSLPTPLPLPRVHFLPNLLPQTRLHTPPVLLPTRHSHSFYREF